MLRKLGRHLRRGTLRQILDQKLGRQSLAQRVRWQGTWSTKEAAEALAQRADDCLSRAGNGAWLAVCGSDGELRRQLEARLLRRGLDHRNLAPEALATLDTDTARGLTMILCSSGQTREITEMGRAAAFNPALAGVPFEYVGGLDLERVSFRKHDNLADTFFVAPQLLESFPVYGLYEESLRHFEQMCGLRDYLDFAQCLRHVVTQQLSGDIAEFGSFRGHSGWLMARLLQNWNSDKKLYLFDMFEHFPDENMGIDHFWSHTHPVNYEEVKGKFSDLPNVRLVRGDFTKTLETSGIGPLAMAYIDCDSLRATRYLIDTILDRHLVPGGLLVIEDYGHPALLGSRIAVHASLEQRHGLFRFYSQFSGLYVVVKQA
jgi:predicted O-methyltransferase YrrM